MNPQSHRKMTKAERQKHTILVAQDLAKVRDECAYIHSQLRETPHVRLCDIYTARGLDGLTFDAVCHALSAANIPIWPSQLAKPGQALQV